MISNNTSYKVKPSKSPRDIYDYEEVDDRYENNANEDDLIEVAPRSRYIRDGRFRGAGRGRAAEFRSSWVHERRGGSFRGRGSTRGRNDRESSELYLYNRKYFDSSRNLDFAGSTHGKFYEPEKKNDIKLNLPEDTRISKLLRRLSMESDQDNSLAISKKLLEVLLLPDNAPYVRKAFHILGESMFEILQVSPGPLAKKQAAQALGRMGYIMAQENDFERYQNWLLGKMNDAYEDLQILLIESFNEVLAFERESPILEEHIESLMHHLVSLIETTESAPVFKVILNVFMSLVELYPDHFYPLFRDTVDLLFGWHVDHTQPMTNIEFISANLQRISKHFQSYLEFSVSLIENFVEDISNDSKQLNATNESTFLEHVTVLILALNTVLKCLSNTFHPAENKFVSIEFVNNCITQIVKTTNEALDSYISDNLVIAANDSIGILLAHLETKSHTLSNMIYTLIDLEISLINEFSDMTVVSMLLFISKALKELSANLPVELIEKLVGPNSEIIKLSHSPYTKIQQSVICVYQALLNLKNVSLVQEAYRYILGDFEVIYRQLVPSIKPFTLNNPFEFYGADLDKETAELSAVFLLRCLSQLANASSIIVMWALKPSILELVAINLEPYNSDLARYTPTLQYSLIYLLYYYCKCYNHYISTSSLVTANKDHLMLGRFSLSDGLMKDDMPHASPNSGNFTIILDTIYRTLNTEITNELVILLLQWINDIVTKSESYLSSIYNAPSFIQVTEILVKCGHNINDRISLSVCEILEKLIANKQLSWNSTFLINLCNLCKLHMSSNDDKVKNAYSNLLLSIPWDVSLVQLSQVNTTNHLKQQCSSLRDYNLYMVAMAQFLHLTGAIYSEMCPLQFKTFMNFLLKNDEPHNRWLEDIFTTCLSLDSESQMNMELFYDLGVNSKNVLHNWITLEAAQFCVNSKLRTPLGKPNETFTKIEGALNLLGNSLISGKKDVDMSQQTGRLRVRLLLQFIEHLEKCIFNASEGCANAMTQPNKLVKSFFMANANTCNEWITRIRMVVIHIALHVGEYSVAIRHSQALLKELAATGKSGTIDFEKTTMFVAFALLNLHETEAIYGLYVWCKSLQGKRYSWIKSVAEQSNKKYEIAIECYKKVLHDSNKKSAENNENSKKMDAETLHFVKDQIAWCYKECNEWIDLIEWQEQSAILNQEEPNFTRKYRFYDIDLECAKELAKTDMNSSEINELGAWDKTFDRKTWSCYETISNIENSLHCVALKIPTGVNSDVVNLLDKTCDLIQESIAEYLTTSPSDLFSKFGVFQYIGKGLKEVMNIAQSSAFFAISSDFLSNIRQIDSSALRKMLWWSDYFSYDQLKSESNFSNALRLEVIKRSRKERNYKNAFKNVYKLLKDQNLMIDDLDYIVNLGETLKSTVLEVPVWTVDTAKTLNEIIKLLYLTNETKDEAFNLSAITSTAISKYTELYPNPEVRKISSKMLLKLANWIQINENVQITDMNTPLGKLLMVIPEIGVSNNNSSTVIPLNEMAVGKLLQFSINQCTDLSKSWMAFGTWCYRWGRKILDRNSNVKGTLTEEDKVAIINILPSDISENELNSILQILSQTRGISDEEDIDSNDIQTSVMIKNQLQTIPVLANAGDSELFKLVQIWKDTQKRVYNYYTLSAEAYFRYLHLVTHSENVSISVECNSITVTLRLLRLIVKYALELQGTLEEGLQTSPTQPWKVIIPQLFSRLNHPESYVHHCVSDLLCRVAEDAPHLITFPAVVGALEGGLKFDFSEITLAKDCLSQVHEQSEDETNDEEDNYESDNEETTNSLQSCFKIMVDTLSKQDPDTISQVQTLVKELRRITLLWDELWLGTLCQHLSEFNKRQQQLEFEIEKVNDNVNLDQEQKISLIAEKHRIIIKPIVFILEQLWEITKVEAETPHEIQFQEKFLTEIEEVIDKLKKPEHPDKPQESLQPLRTLQKKFSQKYNKRASYTLKMQDISPVLSSIKDTYIAMPGLATSSKTRVTVSHVSNVVSILPTKTKPKKLIFYGSDGQTYIYLFKGLEDLHLDERIMQFLSIANTMMAQNANPSERCLYRARHYSVIPLGPRSGLINWVDGTTPIFSLYKRWQQREAAKQTQKTNSSNANVQVLRPSELFYNKLNPLLQEHGVKNLDQRKEWPLSVLKQVLSELIAETPSDLLTKELWCNAVNARDWWQTTKRYSYSIAVMSIIGYIIGLGDRHLDNMLVDLTSGEVVHIDYNVCFEKGKTLRVPEKVPFRLTPNIRDALGVTGVEGIFRLVCENVLKTMRKSRETLLTLLEAFVYDPLIDWTVGGEVLAGTSFGNFSIANNSKQSRKELEKEVTISMFNVRCTEINVEWNENKLAILEETENLKDKLNNWLKLDVVLNKTEDKLQDLHQQMALVKEAEAHGVNNHSLYGLPAKYESYHKTQDALHTARRDLDNIIAECQRHLSLYGDALLTLNNTEILSAINFKIFMNDDGGNNVFDLVREFLHNAGKDDLINQCDNSEMEIGKLVKHHVGLLQNCIKILQDYKNLLGQCPQTYLDNHRMNLVLKWTHFMIEHPNLETCDLISEKFNMFVEISDSFKGSTSFLLCLDTFYKDITLQLNKLAEEMPQNNSADIQNAYINAKAGITNFLNNEKNANKAWTFVIVTELLILNRNFLTLETTAHRSGDWLIKLTSREGEWFLDDLVFNSSRAVELINNLPFQVEDEMSQLINSIKVSSRIYKGLQDMHFNFHTIILPESMKKIQSEDLSVLQMISDLNKLILSMGVSIPEVIMQLFKILPCLLMQMEINASFEFVLEKVAQLKLKFAKLVGTQSEGISNGKMLLMGFNGLFEQLSAEWSNLINTLGSLNVPNSWKKVDQVKDAKSISAHILNAKVQTILEDIFLLKRLHAMSEFFNLSLEMCQSFNGSTVIAYTDDQLVKPIRQFIADFTSRQLLGVMTENIGYAACYLLQHLGFDVSEEIEQRDIGAESKVPLDDLYHKAWNVFLKQGLFSQSLLSQASNVESNLKVSWTKIQETKKLHQKLNLLQSIQFRLHNQITALNFMYEEALMTFQLCNHVRSKFVMDVKKQIGSLQAVQDKLRDVYSKQSVLIESAYQRLNWAKGANPNVVEISAAFETAIKERNGHYQSQLKIGTNVLSICSTILHHELLRSRSLESKAFDKIFLTTFEKWRIACQYSLVKKDTFTSIEESVLGLLTSEIAKDPKWIVAISEKISDLITTNQEDLNRAKTSLVQAIDQIVPSLESLKTHYNVHLKLMSDMKNLIKVMAKIEDYNVGAQQFITDYRAYIDNFAPVFANLKREIKKEEVEETLKLIATINQSTPVIYDALLSLETKRRRATLTRQDGLADGLRALPEKQDSTTMKVQHRNAYAVGVWRRVKMKLEGRDPDPSRKYTAQELVDYVIREATSLDNLALLYEGWTPWV